MNRFMVRLGSGCPWLLLAVFSISSARAELPRYHPSPPAAQITWHETLDAGWRESRRRRVPMVIFITSERCQYCDAMKQTTWRDASVRRRIAGGFVAIRLNSRRNAATLARINVPMYPTTLIGMPKGKVVAHRAGYQPPAAVHSLLSEVATH